MGREKEVCQRAVRAISEAVQAVIDSRSAGESLASGWTRA